MYQISVLGGVLILQTKNPTKQVTENSTIQKEIKEKQA